MPAQLNQRTGSTYTRIASFGAYRPERVVPNSELVEAIDSSDEWIRERTGIVTRRFAAPDETVVDMAEKAGRQALEASDLTPDGDVAVIVASVTHNMFTPAAAPIVADRLGLKGSTAFDISAACAGYCHGIGLASDMIKAGSAAAVLVIGAEKLSRVIDPTDRGTAFIFGDGAGAALVTPSDHPAIGPTVWGSDGSAWETIRPSDVDGVPGETITMQGQAVFRWAVWSMAPVAQQALAQAGLGVDDLDLFIPHQANLRIVDALVKQLKLPGHVQVARDIADSGNTSAASIPLASERMVREGVAKSGDIALQIGFGAGLSYAAQVIEIP